MKIEKLEFYCDKCGKKLKTFSNNCCIVTEISKGNGGPWQRLKLKIENHHGMHNDGHSEDAALCKKCVLQILTDAKKRVLKGERVTAGEGQIGQLGFDQTL